MVLSVFHRTDGTNLSAEARLACLYMYLVTPASSKTAKPKRFRTDAVDVFRCSAGHQHHVGGRGARRGPSAAARGGRGEVSFDSPASAKSRPRGMKTKRYHTNLDLIKANKMKTRQSTLEYEGADQAARHGIQALRVDFHRG